MKGGDRDMFYRKDSFFLELCQAFPQKLKEDANFVSLELPQLAYPCAELTHRIRRKEFIPGIAWGDKNQVFLMEGEEIILPYRCYFLPFSQEELERLTECQKKLYACICLLHPDGYFREKFLRYLLGQSLEIWMLPFLLKLSGEYVKEILQVIYEARKDRDNTIFQKFSKENPQQLQHNYSRMTSYWNEYYRFEITHPCIRNGREGIRTDLRDYVGYALFRSCWGYSPRRKGERKI